MRCRCWFVIVLLTLIAPRTTSAQQTITYTYDDLGRLIAVTDPSGDTAVYHYDAVGNILSIDRYASSTVSIIAFSPARGPVGTTVTLHGTGFSATAGQDTVTFNGTVAAVTSASPTTLVVTVPSAATTGPIAVTVTTGSATSTLPFTVLQDSGAPSITNISPQIGLAGTTITVTGTNFDPTVSFNRAILNRKLATVTAATTTSLTTSSPSFAMGGHISVATPRGTAVSTADFYVPPSPYTAADVLVTDRITFGSSKNVSIGTAGKIALLLFDGTAGQGVSVWTSSSTFPTTTSTLSLVIVSPDGTTLASALNNGSNRVFLDRTVLPISGTYTLMLDPAGTNTGTATLDLYAATNVTATIATDGTGVPVSLMTPGQNAVLTFSGTAGQAVSAWTSSSTFAVGYSSLSLAIKKPDGTTLASAVNNGTTTVFLDQTVLPVTGTYTLVLDPAGTTAGTATLKLFTATNVTGTIATDGPEVPVSLMTPGQNATLTFSGTAGQAVSAWTSSSAFAVGYGSLSLAIKKPDGTTLANAVNNGTTTVFLDQTVLPVTGTYTLVLDPAGATTGTATLKLVTITDFTGTITTDGTGVPVSLATPGKNGRLSFNGSSGQQVTVHLASNTIGSVTVKLLKPDGTQLTSTSSSASSFNLSTQTLPSTGTYTIVIDPIGVSTGSITVSVTNP